MTKGSPAGWGIGLNHISFAALKTQIPVAPHNVGVSLNRLSIQFLKHYGLYEIVAIAVKYILAGSLSNASISGSR